MMRRSARLLAAVLAQALVAPAVHAASDAERALSEPTHDVAMLAARAYVWGMPLVEAARIRERFVGNRPEGDAAGQMLNRFKHRRQLAGPEMKAGVGPNNDTIYSLAWVDLADGPLVMTAPDFGSRYYTFSINFADSSAEQSLGQRTHGGQLPPLFLHGPGYRGRVPHGMVDVPCKTRYVNIAGRILVRAPEEYDQVHALQDQLGLYRWADWQQGRRIPAPAGQIVPMSAPPAGSSEALRFFHELGAVLPDAAVDPAERRMLASLAPLGLTREHGFDPARLGPTQRAALARGYEQGRQWVAEASLRLGGQQNGWTTNYRGPRFGRDWLLRAAVAKDQIFVAIPEEAVYPIGRVDAGGQPLLGANTYRVHFAPGALPPVDAFWSITAYDDQGFMIPNPIARYSVGDRTSGLLHDADGGVTITLAAQPPAGPNWLPVPSNAPFYLMMRLYRPRSAVLNGQWRPPAIERLASPGP